MLQKTYRLLWILIFQKKNFSRSYRQFKIFFFRYISTCPCTYMCNASYVFTHTNSSIYLQLLDQLGRLKSYFKASPLFYSIRKLQNFKENADFISFLFILSYYVPRILKIISYLDSYYFVCYWKLQVQVCYIYVFDLFTKNNLLNKNYKHHFFD